MSIVKKLSSSFSSSIRSRGLDYYMSGLVRVVEGSKNRVRAVVRGTSNYAVELELRGRDLRVSCECPYYLDDLCKHIWAALLTSEARGYLSGPDPERVVMKEQDYDEEFDEGGDGGSDEDEEYDHEIYGSARRPSALSLPAPIQQARREPVKPSWRQNLSALAHSMKSALSRSQARGPRGGK